MLLTKTAEVTGFPFPDLERWVEWFPCCSDREDDRSIPLAGRSPLFGVDRSCRRGRVRPCARRRRPELGRRPGVVKDGLVARPSAIEGTR